MTNLNEFQQKIAAFLPEIELYMNEPMSKHTSFRIGGPAEVMAFPKNTDELRRILKTSALLDIKPFILGAGTNILAPDEGLRGIVICLKDSLDAIQMLDERHICVAAGVTMSRAAIFAANHGLGGFEFMHGIPGTVGGGVYMNAGAYGSEIKDVCQSVEVMTSDGQIVTYTADQMEFSYRHSRLQQEDSVVLSAVFELVPMEKDIIRANMQDLLMRRKKSQPLEYPSAGSAFKRPDSGYAAAMIDQAGLKGYRIGGAAVSDKHAGFIVNLGGATATDVKTLIENVSCQVFDQTGIRLEPEIRIL